MLMQEKKVCTSNWVGSSFLRCQQERMPTPLFVQGSWSPPQFPTQPAGCQCLPFLGYLQKPQRTQVGYRSIRWWGIRVVIIDVVTIIIRMVTRRLIVPKPILLLEFPQLPVISNLFEEIARLDILAGQPHVRKEWGRNGQVLGSSSTIKIW